MVLLTALSTTPPVSANVFTDIADYIRSLWGKVDDGEKWLEDTKDEIEDRARTLRILTYVLEVLPVVQDNVYDIADQFNRMTLDQCPTNITELLEIRYVALSSPPPVCRSLSNTHVPKLVAPKACRTQSLSLRLISVLRI